MVYCTYSAPYTPCSLILISVLLFSIHSLLVCRAHFTRATFRLIMFYDVETDLLYPHIEPLPFEFPLSPITRVAGAIFYTATNPDSETSGASWIVLDDGPLYAVPKEELRVGLYDKLYQLMSPSRNHPRYVYVHTFRHPEQHLYSEAKPKSRWRLLTFLRPSLPYIRPALLSLGLALVVWRKFRSLISLRVGGG